jgi:hypothetical protein
LRIALSAAVSAMVIERRMGVEVARALRVKACMSGVGNQTQVVFVRNDAYRVGCAERHPPPGSSAFQCAK